MPRSERARLIDLVKLRGVVEGSLRSVYGSAGGSVSGKQMIESAKMTQQEQR